MAVGTRRDPVRDRWKRSVLRAMGRGEKQAKVRELRADVERAERELEDHPFPGMGTSRDEWEAHILGAEDAATLKANRAQIAEIQADLDAPEATAVEPAPTPEPVPEPVRAEDPRKRGEWRKAAVAFRPHKLLADRCKDPRIAARILKLYDDALKKADARAYDDAMALLAEATTLAQEAQRAITAQKTAMAAETLRDRDRQIAAFAPVARPDDPEHEFDSDTDSRDFHLANAVDDTGALTTSPALRTIQQILADCNRRKQALQRAGASIDEIIEAVYKNVPKNFWPDDVVQEVALFKAVQAEIEAEKGLQDAQDELETLANASDTAGSAVSGSAAAMVGLTRYFGAGTDQAVAAENALKALATGFSIANGLVGSSMRAIDAGERDREADAGAENPVKEKIAEFQRNKAIVQCVNMLMSTGLSNVGDLIPVIGMVAAGKDVLLEVAKAGYYFKNTLNLEALKKGAKTDPRSAAMLPLARLAREQRLALADSTLSAVGTALRTAGKAAELAVVAAPVGLALDAGGAVIKYGGKAILSGINWSDASKAAAMIKKAAGPPPCRKAQIEVLKLSSKFAKFAIAHLAMRENDPWAIGHLENIGLEREDINNPATTSRLIREYMALKGGGILGDAQGEEQSTPADGFLGRAGSAMASGAEWVRDKIVGRNTSISYDPSWRADSGDLTVADWNAAKAGAIAAGWYDSRPGVEPDLAAYATALTAYNRADADNLDASIAAATALQAAIDTLKVSIRAVEAVTNDRRTTHAGMQAFLQQWWNLAMTRGNEVTASRSRLIDSKTFPGKTGPALEAAKRDFLVGALAEARQQQSRKVESRKTLIANLWDAHKIQTPYGSCKLLDFPNQTKKAPLRFSESEVAELAVEIGELRSTVLSRLNGELMASPTDEELRRNLVPCARVADGIIIEALRVTSERLHEARQRRTGAASPPLWNPQTADIVLDWRTWRRVIDAAKAGGWDQEENTGFTDSLKAYQAAVLAFDQEQARAVKNPTAIAQNRGLILGALDALETKFQRFKPVTRLKFYHPGLAAYRAGMLELCLSARVRYSAGFFEEASSAAS
jgi:hypothetical protein